MPTEKDLSKYRLEQAAQCLKDAKMLLENDSCKSAANRSYYCVFHSMRSLLALENLDFKRHKGIISHFRKTYIKSKILGERLSDILDDLFGVRSASDYDDFYLISKQETTEQIANAEYFYTQIKAYLENRD